MINLEEKQFLINLLENNQEIPEDFKYKLFPTKQKEYELAYAGKMRKEDLLANEDGVFTVPLQIEKLFNDSEYEHNTDDTLLRVSGVNVANFTLTTGNLIGFIKQGDYSLKISSRFGDNFLRFIIADADGFLELENLGGQINGEGYEWLLAYLWNIKFKRAYRLGLPKTYITKKR